MGLSFGTTQKGALEVKGPWTFYLGGGPRLHECLVLGKKFLADLVTMYSKTTKNFFLVIFEVKSFQSLHYTLLPGKVLTFYLRTIDQLQLIT